MKKDIEASAMKNQAQKIFTELGEFSIGLLALVFLFWSHGRGLDLYPGFHFDEGWAARYSYRIAFEPAFWPWQAMSPYTSPWTHYMSALFFKLLGVSLETYKLSYVFWSLGGLLLISFVLYRELSLRVAVIFLGLAASCPMLLHNHRFAVELCSLLPFCFGGVLLALSLWNKENCAKLSRNLFWIFLVLGVTSHILFLGVGLALLLAALWENPRLNPRQIELLRGSCLLLLPFLFRSLSHNAWPLKAWALIVLCLGLFVWTFISQAQMPSFFTRRKVEISTLLAAIGLIFLFNFLVFFEGSWTVLFAYGYISYPLLVGSYLLIPMFLWFMAIRGKAQDSEILHTFLKFFFFVNLCLGLIMLRPSPRYFEISALLFLVILSLLINRIWKSGGAWAFLCLVLIGGLNIFANYHYVGSEGLYQDKVFRLGLLSDSSSDMIPKNGVVDFLLSQGCSLENEIHFEDARLGSVLKDLALLKGSELPNASSSCLWKNLKISRKVNFIKNPDPHFEILKDFGALLLLKDKK